MLTSVNLRELHHLQADLTRIYIYIYIYKWYIFVQAQICTNDYFPPNLFSAKGDDFFPLLFSVDNRLGRSTMVYLFS